MHKNDRLKWSNNAKFSWTSALMCAIRLPHAKLSIFHTNLAKSYSNSGSYMDGYSKLLVFVVGF